MAADFHLRPHFRALKRLSVVHLRQITRRSSRRTSGACRVPTRLSPPSPLEPLPSAQLLLRGFERERLRRLVVEHLSALHGLGAVGDRLHELGYLLVLLGELGILDGKLVDERGERGGICRIGLFCRISGVFLRGIRAYCSFNDFGCRLSFGFGNISYSICGFLLDRTDLID